MESNRRQISILDHCKVKAVSLNSDIEHGISSTDFRMRCFNYTYTGIWHKTRLGVNTYLEPMANRTEYVRERLDVELEWRVPIKGLQGITDEIRDNITGGGILVRKIMDEFDHQRRMVRNGNGMGYVTVTLLVSFPAAVLDELGGSVYLYELDLQLVVQQRQRDRIDHPYGPNETMKRAFMGLVPHLSNDTLVFSLKAVDNSRTSARADRFINLGGEVYQVPIERDERMTDGVHLLCRNPVRMINDGTASKDVWQKSFGYDEADKIFHLYRTPEDALHDGDREAILKQKQLAVKLEDADLKRQQLLDDHRRTMDDRTHRDEVLSRRHREEQVKEHSKNLGDWIKLVGMFVTTTVGLLTALHKLKPT